MRGADFMQILNGFYPSTITLKAYTIDLVHERTHKYYECVYMYQLFLIQFTVLKATLIIFIIMLYIYIYSQTSL